MKHSKLLLPPTAQCRTKIHDVAVFPERSLGERCVRMCMRACVCQAHILDVDVRNSGSVWNRSPGRALRWWENTIHGSDVPSSTNFYDTNRGHKASRAVQVLGTAVSKRAKNTPAHHKHHQQQNRGTLRWLLTSSRDHRKSFINHHNNNNYKSN